MQHDPAKRESAKPMENLHTFIEFGATGVDAMAVALILGAFLWASVRFFVQTGRHVADVYPQFKTNLGRALLLGLEFLVAADVIRTIGVAPTFRNVSTLAAIIMIRTVLSWSLVVEMEGRWPWQPAIGKNRETKAEG
jgi:uncharacterized membrane protein